MKLLMIAVLSLVLGGGCTWVKPTLDGERVRLAQGQADVTTCRKIGNTTVSLLDRVASFERNPKKVEAELAILGRNSAAEMGGDTIVPVSDIFQGERSFAVYRCR